MVKWKNKAEMSSKQPTDSLKEHLIPKIGIHFC